MAAQACTGGLTSLKFHLYDGHCPSGFIYHSLITSSNWCLANVGSTTAIEMHWNARSHAAYQGYSHLSGIMIMYWFFKCVQSLLRPVNLAGLTGVIPSLLVNHCSTSK